MTDPTGTLRLTLSLSCKNGFYKIQLLRLRTFRTLRTVANIAYTAGCFLKCNSITKYSYIQAESRFLTVLHLLFTVWMF